MLLLLFFLISKMFHESELSQNNGFYAKSVCLGKVT